MVKNENNLDIYQQGKSNHVIIIWCVNKCHTTVSLFYYFIFWQCHMSCRILVPSPGYTGSTVLVTGPPGKSLPYGSFNQWTWFNYFLYKSQKHNERKTNLKKYTQDILKLMKISKQSLHITCRKAHIIRAQIGRGRKHTNFRRLGRSWKGMELGRGTRKTSIPQHCIFLQKLILREKFIDVNYVHKFETLLT